MLGFSALSAENMPKEVFPQLEVHCRRTLTVPATFFSDTHSLSGLLAGPSAAVGERQIQAIAYDPNRQLGLGDAATQTAALQYKDVTAGSSRKHPDGWVSFAQWADLRAKHWVSDPTDYHVYATQLAEFKMTQAALMADNSNTMVPAKTAEKALSESSANWR